MQCRSGKAIPVMLTHSEVLEDQSELRAQLQRDGGAHRELLRLNWARPLGDIALDWATILAATAAVAWVGWATLPLALLVVANRQRALGNILHDAGHRNLWRTRRVNDAVAGMLVAPLVFVSLERYREDHFRHHMQLGSAGADPDLIAPPQALPRRWLASYLRQVLSWRAWWSNFLGHLGAAGVPWSGRAGIAAWWLGALALLFGLAGTQFTLSFIGLWLLARATAFHLITTLREMCDHFGLRPGGILSFTRDMAVHGPARWLIHPRNNGYHLTHHLLPAVPYYHLPRAHALFRRMPAYRCHGTVCDAYFTGPAAVVRAWETGARP
jgi:fatty acid desaturase